MTEKTPSRSWDGAFFVQQEFPKGAILQKTTKGIENKMKAKQLLLAIGCMGILTLGACSNDEKQEAEPSQEQPAAQEAIPTTDDPMEAGNKSAGFKAYESSPTEQSEILGWYVSDKTDKDGFNVIETNGVTMKFAVVETKDSMGDSDIHIFGERTNDTDKEIVMDSIEVFTDKRETADTGTGYGGGLEPQEVAKFSELLFFENGMPDSFEMSIPPAIEADKQYEEENMNAEPIKMKFHRE